MRPVRSSELARMSIALIALVSCRHPPSSPAPNAAPSSRTAAQARCFQDAVPPPWHWPHDPHELIDGLNDAQKSDAACPLDLPAEHAACALPAEAACYYVSFGAPCDPTSATCEGGSFVLGRIEF